MLNSAAHKEFDIIRTITRLAKLVVETDFQEADEDCLISVFNDIEKYYRKKWELFEQLFKQFPCLLKTFKLLNGGSDAHCAFDKRYKAVCFEACTADKRTVNV